MMGNHLSIMIVTIIYASGLREANNSRNRAGSKVKVTKKVTKSKKNKCHNVDPMSSGETPMRQCLVVKIFAKNHSAKNSERTVGSCQVISENSYTCTMHIHS